MENDKILFDTLVNFLKTEEEIEVNVEEYYMSNKFPNASAGQDEYIILYKKPTDDCWGMLTSLLIHEFGHICCWQLGQGKHNEFDAWLRGIDNIPIKFWPNTLKNDYRICLNSYNIPNNKIDILDIIVDDYLTSSK